ncbi:MAG TPA: glycerophosphodiester phosphodiesterase family protein [Pseudonocardiaceae bacterium]|nr:glycerophosphodiester phosphodiesterase family protein [Pseudonocardiaceae bacterium]
MLPDIVAHRGASADRAEHTMAAYALAIEQGADGLECDVRLSRDGHLVCVHDRTVNRTSNGRGAVSTMTLDRMSDLDFGAWHDDWPGSADELVQADETTQHGPLTLASLLGLVADTGYRTKLFVETKHPVRYGGLVEVKLVALLARHGLAAPETRAESPVVVMSFSSVAMRRIRTEAPHLPTVLLLGRLWPHVADGSLPPWADVTGPGVHLLRTDPDYVERSRASGHDTYCWTVDEPADVALCRDLGVRYLATNSPADTRRLLDG